MVSWQKPAQDIARNNTLRNYSKYCQTTSKSQVAAVRLNDEIFGGQAGVWQNFQRPEVIFNFFLLQL